MSEQPATESAVKDEQQLSKRHGDALSEAVEDHPADEDESES